MKHMKPRWKHRWYVKSQDTNKVYSVGWDGGWTTGGGGCRRGWGCSCHAWRSQKKTHLSKPMPAEDRVDCEHIQEIKEAVNQGADHLYKKRPKTLTPWEKKDSATLHTGITPPTPKKPVLLLKKQVLITKIIATPKKGQAQEVLATLGTVLANSDVLGSTGVLGALVAGVNFSPLTQPVVIPTDFKPPIVTPQTQPVPVSSAEVLTVTGWTVKPVVVSNKWVSTWAVSCIASDGERLTHNVTNYADNHTVYRCRCEQYDSVKGCVHVDSVQSYKYRLSQSVKKTTKNKGEHWDVEPGPVSTGLIRTWFVKRSTPQGPESWTVDAHPWQPKTYKCGCLHWSESGTCKHVAIVQSYLLKIKRAQGKPATKVDDPTPPAPEIPTPKTPTPAETKPIRSRARYLEL